MIPQLPLLSNFIKVNIKIFLKINDPGGSRLDPGGSRLDPGGSELDPRGPALDPGGSMLDPDGPRLDPLPSSSLTLLKIILKY